MGGCVSSSHFERGRRGANVFHVWNVDEYGSPVSPGHIELTDSSLVLHQKSSRESVIWPMRSLRRYGFDAELFSFESGRRCTTGPGVYAFKCRRAETLFNMLQERILSSGQDELSNHSGVVTIPPPPPPLPVATTTTTNQQVLPPPPPRQASPITTDNDNYLEPIVINRSNSNGSNGQRHHHHSYVNDTNSYVDAAAAANYVNTSPEHLTLKNGVIRGHSLDDETNYAKLDDLLKQEHTANRHLYMNVTVTSTGCDAQTLANNVNNDSAETFSCDHCYANVAPTSVVGVTTTSSVRHSKSLFTYPRQVNYAILDLRKRSRNNNNNSVQVVDAPAQATPAAISVLCVPAANTTSTTLEGYAKIDFDKTTALSNSINPTLDDDQSVRKTRHNSNASSLLHKKSSLAEAE